MGEIVTIGLDLAKNVFQVHGVDSSGAAVLKKALRRAQVLAFFRDLPSCLIGMEACATAHHWARELIALGHEVRLMPPQYVKAYVKRNKNDAADAEAICEAVRRPSMRFVPVKTEEQQSALAMHRVRELLVRQRTMLINALRSHLAEIGIVEAQGATKVGTLVAIVQNPDDRRISGSLRTTLTTLAQHLERTGEEIATIDRQIAAWHKGNAVSQRLASIPGIGTITATAITASVPDARSFRSGREFAAWLGLVPKQNSTGGKARLGSISKRGDSYLRRLLINCAMSALLRSKAIRSMPWVKALIEKRKRPLVVAVALANKTARVAWAIMSRGTVYQAVAAAA
jgi:transposase